MDVDLRAAARYNPANGFDWDITEQIRDQAAESFWVTRESDKYHSSTHSSVHIVQ